MGRKTLTESINSEHWRELMHQPHALLICEGMDTSSPMPVFSFEALNSDQLESVCCMPVYLGNDMHSYSYCGTVMGNTP